MELQPGVEGVRKALSGPTQADLVLFFALLCLSDVSTFVVQIEGKTFHQQKQYDSLSYHTHFFTLLDLLLWSGTEP